jgi:hypothetical protein
MIPRVVAAGRIRCSNGHATGTGLPALGYNLSANLNLDVIPINLIDDYLSIVTREAMVESLPKARLSAKQCVASARPTSLAPGNGWWQPARSAFAADSWAGLTQSTH